ncbi:YbaN family protein [Roseibium sp.]|uniref:YbaN family protein n=1 Tax=Roseibium sp. TaxID=1936156 RepID=UPI003BAD9CA3
MRRFTFKLLGTGCVGLGIIGAFLPILPSTIFFILAAGCFARSSPALEAKILNHPVIGPPVIAWREHGAIPVKAKVIAIAGMAVGYLFFYWSTSPAPWLATGIAIIIIGCATYVVTRPSGPRTEP